MPTPQILDTQGANTDPTNHLQHLHGDQVLPARTQTHHFQNTEVGLSALPVLTQVDNQGLRVALEHLDLTLAVAQDLMEEDQGVGEMHLIKKLTQQLNMEA